MSETQGNSSRKTERDALLVTDGVSKRYKETWANREVNVVIPRGKIVGFVGENGSGKTTFLRIVCGLIKPTSGTFRFETADGSCRIGAIVETPSYQPNMSATDNMRFQARLCGKDENRIEEILSAVGLGDTGRKRAKHFSLGMRQRLGIAIALLSDPELLILDEPTNGLDPQGIVEMRELLKRLAAEREMTILVSSHILSELSLLADYYLFIHKGRILRAMEAEELFAGASRQIRFECKKDPTEFLREAVKEGWIERADRESGINVLYGPQKYPEILRAMSLLEVTSLETCDDSLEARYMKIMQGGADK